MSDVVVIKPTTIISDGISIQTRIRKKNTCAYVRVSTDNEDQLNSYESQINHYTGVIKNNKEWNFIRIYADEGISGTQIKNRTQFQRMIEDCKNGKIDVIIAKSISRFARNTVDTLNNVRLLRELNVDVYFEKENIHTLKMDSEMFLTLYSAFAQAESESTSMNVKMGYRAKMKRGEPVGGAKCYGYIWDKNEKKLIVDPEASKVVKYIFKLYLEGYGSYRISKRLHDEGIKTPTGKEHWSKSVMQTILTNCKYVGDLCGQKSYIESPITHRQVKNRGQLPMYYKENDHEPIIDRETWNKVQEIYKKRSLEYMGENKDIKKYSMKYTFSNMIVCGHCGCSYTRRKTIYKNKDGVGHEHVYWHCSSDVKKSNCPDSITIRDEELKSLFMTLFNTFLNKTRNDKLINSICETISRDDSQEKLYKINEQIEQCKTKLSRLIELNINQDINDDVFITKNNILNEELRNLEKDKEKVLDVKDSIKKEEKRLKNIANELKNTKTMYSFDEKIFKTLISKIKIGDYDEDGIYQPNIVKFILNIKNLASDENINFLSFRLDERIF